MPETSRRKATIRVGRSDDGTMFLSYEVLSMDDADAVSAGNETEYEACSYKALSLFDGFRRFKVDPRSSVVGCRDPKRKMPHDRCSQPSVTLKFTDDEVIQSCFVWGHVNGVRGVDQ